MPSAVQMKQIFDILGLDAVDATKKIHASNPKLLSKVWLKEYGGEETPAAKKEDSPFASKKAEEYARDNSIEIKGLTGTSVKGKITIGDLRKATEPAKINATPQAQKWCRDEGHEISEMPQGEKITKAMAIDFFESGSESDSDTESDTPEFKLTPKAREIMEEANLDEGDLDDRLKHSGKGDSVLKADMVAFVKLVSAE
jgi:pyruvate/2-oxoglutarate dehydrogenase complex dihydrolipoamide acyltransferase (E2) component